MTQQNDATRVSLWPCVLSYPKLFVPEASSFDDSGDKDPQYSCELWVYESDPRYAANLHLLNNAVEAAKLAKWGPGTQINPHTFKHPLKSLQTKNNPPAQTGLYVRVNTRQKPSVLKRDLATQQFVPVTDPEEAYAGVIVGAALNASAFEIKGPGGSITSRGVKFYINQVILIRNGERLGREPASAEETFGADLQQMQFEPIESTAQVAVAQHLHTGVAPMPNYGLPTPPQVQPQYAPVQMPGYPPVQPQAAVQMPQMPATPPMPGYPGYPPQ